MIIVVGRENCTWCVRAKTLLENRGEPYVYLDYNKSALGKKKLDDLRPEFDALGQTMTVPQCFKADRHIGGYEDLVAFLG